MPTRCVFAVLSLSLLFVSAQPAPAQYIYIANSGEGTVSEIDINTNKEVARFRTWFGTSPGSPPPYFGLAKGPAPSRIAVDVTGNIYVLNRMFDFPPPSSTTPKKRLPLLYKILPPLPAGTTNTSQVVGNGLIGSLLPGEVMNLVDSTLDPDKVNPSEIQEVRIPSASGWPVEIGSAPGDLGGWGRALCIDLDGYLWVGLNDKQKYYRVNPVNGSIVGSAIPTPNHSPYGCEIDSQGILWSAGGIPPSSSFPNGFTLAEINTRNVTVPAIIRSHPATKGKHYAIALQRGCGETPRRVYLSDQTTHTYIEFDPATNLFSNPTNPALSSQPFASYAIAVDLAGKVISGYINGRIVKYDPAAGTVLWDTGTPTAGSTGASTDLHGIIVDSQNNIWAVHRNENRVVKYNGLNGQIIAKVDVGKEPYTYANVQPPNCPCAQIDKTSIQCVGQNAGIPTYSFGFTFTNHGPFATPVTHMGLTSTNATILTPTSPYPLPNPVPINGQGTVNGTFTVTPPLPSGLVCLDIQLFGREAEWCCPKQKVCFRVPECHECAQVQWKIKCRPDGTWYLELTVTNNGPTPSTSVQVFSTTPGVVVTPTNSPLALASGGSGMLQLGITGAAPGQTIDLTVNLHGLTDPKTGVYDWCCTSRLQVIVPKLPCFHQGDMGAAREREQELLACSRSRGRIEQ